MLNTNVKRIFGLLALVLVLSACQKQNESTSVATQRNSRAVGVNQTTGGVFGSNTTLNGYVYADESYQQDFQEAVVGFLDASVSSDYVGYVSAMGRNNTGVFFRGYVELANGPLRGAVNGQVNVQSGSKLVVVVMDEYTGQNDSSGVKIPPFQVPFVNAQGYVSGNNALIRFQDDYGWVEMRGSFDNSYFRGTISWDNQRRYDGQQGSAGTLGNFEVPTCEFFRCN